MTTNRTLIVTAATLLAASAGLVGCASATAEKPQTSAAAATVVHEGNTVSSARLSAQTATVAAQAALAQCEADGLGFVTVAVVDRNGQLQALVRGNNAAEHTIEAAQQKAYTSAAFGASTSDLVERADENGLHRLPGTLFMPGGVSVKLGDASIAGIGVGGAPSGMADQQCAAAGLAAIEAEVAPA
ncbi:MULTISPECIES: heme-binding protein [unclassified Leucobacter]|uniref:GlcG/HbpS family heme-binding protein n=1 Tax=unclassified Leucobacter TaxID=2621730 RepID=UPI00165E263B|nr:MULTISPECIES: heme-binding protein [unclassified Leucobacter]MBC9937581.1 heme-binding protein [Leucobacter sp. cx-87]